LPPIGAANQEEEKGDINREERLAHRHHPKWITGGLVKGKLPAPECADVHGRTLETQKTLGNEDFKGRCVELAEKKKRKKRGFIEVFNRWATRVS